MEHFESVLDLCSLLQTELHESGDHGIIDKIEKHMGLGQRFIGDSGSFIRVGEHAYGRGVDHNEMGAHNLRCQLLIGDAAGFRASADAERGKAELMEPIADSTRSTARAEHQGRAVKTLVEKWTDGLAKADEV